jgi:hypothetical protein
LEKVSDAVPNYNMKTVLGTSKLKVEKSPIYMQHVEGTACTTILMVMENEW